MHILKSGKQSRNSVLGEGVVSEVCLQKRLWRVKFQGSYWYGESDSNFTLHPGDRVRVVGTRNISLLVKPL